MSDEELRIGAELVRSIFVRKPTDDESLSDEWLIARRFSERGLMGYTMLLPPTQDGAAVGELCIAPDSSIEGEWTVCIVQGVPDDPTVADDHVLLSSLPKRLTCGHVRRLLAALGVELKEPIE